MTPTLDKFSRLAALKPARSAAKRPALLRVPDGEDVVAHLIGAQVARNHFGEHLSVRNWYSTPEFAEPSATSLALLSHARDQTISRKTRVALEDPSKWLFLDTETTGLAGGTGTYAFLIGMAWWDAGGLQVEQLFMRDFSEEHSLLHELAARVAERPVLVTFNGKTFDWPLLENRFTMTRVIAIPRLAAHLDLLHTARALWKLRLGSVRLIELERQVLDPARLGWHRGDDIASALIPQFYFDYLRGHSAAPLAGVVRHNQLDLRGLAALFGKINSLLRCGSSADQDIPSLDLFSLSRYFNRRGDGNRAHAACSQAIDLGLPQDVSARARSELAQMAKRRGEYARAEVLWREIAGDPSDGIHACEQLAIYYERRKKDPLRAAEYTKLALAKLRRQRKLGSRNLPGGKGLARIEQRFLHRMARLNHLINLRQQASPTSAPSLALTLTEEAGWKLQLQNSKL